MNENILKAYNLLLYFAGSMVMDSPTEECVIDFWINGKLRSLPVKSNNPRFIMAASQLRESCPDKKECSAALTEDYSRLFSGSEQALAPACASVYHWDRNEPDKVREFYDSYGWVSRTREKVPADHLGLELLFLSRLIDQYQALDDEPCRIEMRKEICTFINNHLLSWVPIWNDEIQQHARSLCYKAIGTLVYACIEDIHGLLSGPSEL